MDLVAQNQYGDQLQYQNQEIQHQEGEIREQMQQVGTDEADIQKELSQINQEDEPASAGQASWQVVVYFLVFYSS